MDKQHRVQQRNLEDGPEQRLESIVSGLRLGTISKRALELSAELGYSLSQKLLEQEPRDPEDRFEEAFTLLSRTQQLDFIRAVLACAKVEARSPGVLEALERMIAADDEATLRKHAEHAKDLIAGGPVFMSAGASLNFYTMFFAPLMDDLCQGPITAKSFNSATGELGSMGHHLAREFERQASDRAAFDNILARFLVDCYRAPERQAEAYLRPLKSDSQRRIYWSLAAQLGHPGAQKAFFYSAWDKLEQPLLVGFLSLDIKTQLSLLAAFLRWLDFGPESIKWIELLEKSSQQLTMTAVRKFVDELRELLNDRMADRSRELTDPAALSSLNPLLELLSQGDADSPELRQVSTSFLDKLQLDFAALGFRESWLGDMMAEALVDDTALFQQWAKTETQAFRAMALSVRMGELEPARVTLAGRLGVPIAQIHASGARLRDQFGDLLEAFLTIDSERQVRVICEWIAGKAPGENGQRVLKTVDKLFGAAMESERESQRAELHQAIESKPVVFKICDWALSDQQSRGHFDTEALQKLDQGLEMKYGSEPGGAKWHRLQLGRKLLGKLDERA